MAETCRGCSVIRFPLVYLLGWREGVLCCKIELPVFNPKDTLLFLWSTLEIRCSTRTFWRSLVLWTASINCTVLSLCSSMSESMRPCGFIWWSYCDVRIALCEFLCEILTIRLGEFRGQGSVERSPWICPQWIPSSCGNCWILWISHWRPLV